MVWLSLSLSQIIIEKSATAVAPGQHHYNMRGSPVKGRDVWDVKKLLEVRESRKSASITTGRCSHL